MKFALLAVSTLTLGIFLSACSGVDRIGDLRTPADPLTDVTPESAQSLASTNFKPEETLSEANSTETQRLNFLMAEWNGSCDEKKNVHPNFKVGQMEGRKISRTLRKEHFFIEFQTKSIQIDQKSSKIVRETRPLRAGSKEFKDKAFAKQAEVDEGKFIFNLEENAEQMGKDPTAAEENVAAQFMAHLSGSFRTRWINTMRAIFDSSNKDPRLCQFKSLGSELVQVSKGKSIINEMTKDAEGNFVVITKTVPSYMKVVRAEGELACQTNKVFPVEIREVEIRSLPVIAADGVSHCQGGLLTRIRSYNQLSTNLKSKTLVLVDREDVFLAPVLSSL